MREGIKINIIEEAKKVISREDVKYIIGYEKGTYGFRVFPSFAETPADTEKFIFSPLCANNLATYIVLEEKLPLPKGAEPDRRKMALFVKGCDSRAIIQLIAENEISREELVILGIPCTGMIDPKKLNARFPNVLNGDVKEENDYFIINADGEEKKVPKEEVLFEKCKTCAYPNPLIYDILLGEELEPKEETYEHIKEFESRPSDERWNYWEEKFSICIRCYACRNVCPICHCVDCLIERLTPQWIRRSVDPSENMIFQLTRVFHLAGRCIGCGECERACPMDIPLTELSKKLEKEVNEIYGYVPGINPEEKPLFAIFKPEG
jgi:ferredoxin